ncbi:50S ribosomal protein L25/general stress protein Ctc [Fulvivirgaceae bacterium BMA10]|uniref:Large ribosomal subunit protein bL25 n=1 Tax=Splendidivirga corallicola TaxID=3051826 RepID=A0ABT8KGP3_9BACT|nr:50S ribosomal protein L25/general stress protein Ctc [Fulvivirgaceae bacterium BMA10]
MKTVEIIGYKRANLGKKESKKLREDGYVPCVLYGGDEQVHFSAPMILFREIVYTADAHFVSLNVEGNEYRCILQDIQFHPVSEIILHADFLQLHEGKLVKMDIPVHLIGQAPGVNKGGTLMHKRRTLRVEALPKNMPEFIEVDISELDFNRAIKVGEVKEENFTVLDADNLSIAVVEVPRALRGKTAEEAEEEGAEEGAETTAPEGESDAAE